MSLFSFSFAFFLLGAQFIKRSFLEKKAGLLAALSVVWVGIGGGTFSFLLYRTWSSNALSQNLLPPNTPISYFIYYIGTRYFLPYGLSLAFAVLFASAMIFINKRCCGRFFDKGEIAIAAASIFLSGFPGVIVFIPALIVFYLVIHVINSLRGKNNERIPLFGLWLPVTLSVILINNFWLSRLDIWKIIKI